MAVSSRFSGGRATPRYLVVHDFSASFGGGPFHGRPPQGVNLGADTDSHPDVTVADFMIHA